MTAECVAERDEGFSGFGPRDQAERGSSLGN